MNHTTLDAIAWTLIHFCWQAAAIAGLYRLLNLALAHRTSQARYLLSLAALLVMLACSVATFAWEVRGGAAPTATSIGASFTGFNQTVKELPLAQVPGTMQASPSPSNSYLAKALPWIDGLWVLGVFALSIRSFGGWWLIHRLRVSSTLEAPTAVRASFLRICAALGLRGPVFLRVSSAITGPVTVGALRAIVLLPLSAATSLSPEELEVVLAHELAHVRRADFFWNLVQTLLETLFFFHPAVWWISAEIRRERELCCDDLALTICPNPFVYAHALFRLEEQRSRRLQLAMALDGHQSQQTLRARIARILGEPAAEPAKTPARPFSLAASCAALMVVLLPVPQVLASFNSTKPIARPATVDANLSPKITGSMPSAALQAAMKVAVPAPHLLLQTASAAPATQDSPSEPAQTKSSYIDQMKAAGYDIDLDKYMAMKIQNITPEYANAMAQIGFGKLSADDLVACKIFNLTPEFIANLKQKGIEVKTVKDAISYRIFDVTPEYVAGMKAAGFDNLGPEKLLALRVQGITPEYASQITQQFAGSTVDDVIKSRIFNIDATFVAKASAHGFTGLSLQKLVELRISGVLDDDSPKK